MGWPCLRDLDLEVAGSCRGMHTATPGPCWWLTAWTPGVLPPALSNDVKPVALHGA